MSHIGLRGSLILVLELPCQQGSEETQEKRAGDLKKIDKEGKIPLKWTCLSRYPLKVI